MAEQRSIWREYTEAFIIAAIFLWFTNTFVIQTFYIPSSSMEDTLLIGDHLFVNRFVYGPTATGIERTLLPFRSVKRGDVVVFRSPENPKLDLVKRCMGVGGDQIEVVTDGSNEVASSRCQNLPGYQEYFNQVGVEPPCCTFAHHELRLNGKVVADSSYAVYKGVFLCGRPTMPPRGPFLVPPGEQFCMGDNRDNSYDSRFWGTVPSHLLKGRALFIYWSYGGQTSDGQFRSYGSTLRNWGKTLLGFFSKSRWERTFKLIR